jgi:GT2 family glycosyltransferase
MPNRVAEQDSGGGRDDELESIAVLIAAHNRKPQTVDCVERLLAQRALNADVLIYVCDDGSTDGTSEALAALPVRVVEGSGVDYWAGGMRRAWRTARTSTPNWYLLLNDDVTLDEDAIGRLLEEAKRDGRVVLGGAVRDPDTGRSSYGGYRSISTLRRLSFQLQQPHSTRLLECDALNGNVFLVTAPLFDRMDGLSVEFQHGMADFDLSMRIKASGIKLALAPGTFGECRGNSSKGRWTDVALDRRNRWRKLNAPTGLPFTEWLTFCRRHGGLLWPLYAVLPWGRVLLGR